MSVVADPEDLKKVDKPKFRVMKAATTGHRVHLQAPAVIQSLAPTQAELRSVVETSRRIHSEKANYKDDYWAVV